LGGAAGEEVRVAGEEVVVDGGVFGGVDEDGIVGLEVVFGEEVGAEEGGVGVSGGSEGLVGLEEGSLPFSLDVEERVLEAEELVGRHVCGGM